MLTFKEAYERVMNEQYAPLPKTTQELSNLGIHYGTKSSSKYRKKRHGARTKAHNTNKTTTSNQAQNISKYRQDKIASESLTTTSDQREERTTEETAPQSVTQMMIRDGVRPLDYRNLPKWMLDEL